MYRHSSCLLDGWCFLLLVVRVCLAVRSYYYTQHQGEDKGNNKQEKEENGCC